MLAMSIDGYNRRSGGYHGKWFHPMQGYADAPTQRGGNLPTEIYKNNTALKDLNKRIRKLAQSDMTRKERSDLYGDMQELLLQLYNIVFDDDAEKKDQWSQLVRTVPRRGLLDTGGNDLRANAVFRGIKALYDDPQGRMNALMLIVRTAKLTSALFISHLPFLREMADVLGFPLQIDEAASGLNDFLDIQDGGIRVRPAGKERVAAQALLELGRQ